MPDPSLDMLSQFARPGTPLYRILQRRLSGAGNSGYMAPGAYGGNAMGSATTPVTHTSAPRNQRYTGTGSVGGGGSTYGVQRGDFQMGGFPTGGGPHLSPGLNLAPDLSFGKAVSTVNGYPLTHPSMPGMTNAATRIRGISRSDSVGMRGPY